MSAYNPVARHLAPWVCPCSPVPHMVGKPMYRCPICGQLHEWPEPCPQRHGNEETDA